jgi:RNA polymerase sigma-70 factor, ECF subfamily
MKAKFLDLATRRRFERLAGRLRADLYRYALWLSRDPQAAEDIVQESMLRAWRGFGELQDEARVRQWLATIVRREFLRFRERRREETMDPEVLAQIAAEDDDPLVGELRAGILALDANYREPLVLQILLGHSTEEIGELMGLTQAAVLTRLHRARERLKRQLLGEETRDSAT